MMRACLGYPLLTPAFLRHLFGTQGGHWFVIYLCALIGRSQVHEPIRAHHHSALQAVTGREAEGVGGVCVAEGVGGVSLTEGVGGVCLTEGVVWGKDFTGGVWVWGW